MSNPKNKGGALYLCWSEGLYIGKPKPIPELSSKTLIFKAFRSAEWCRISKNTHKKMVWLLSGRFHPAEEKK